jgi:hypothetical protein
MEKLRKILIVLVLCVTVACPSTLLVTNSTIDAEIGEMIAATATAMPPR